MIILKNKFACVIKNIPAHLLKYKTEEWTMAGSTVRSAEIRTKVLTSIILHPLQEFRRGNFFDQMYKNKIVLKKLPREKKKRHRKMNDIMWKS